MRPARRLTRITAGVLTLMLTAFAIVPSAGADATPVRWWEDEAIAPPPAELIARLSILCDGSDDQLVAWFDALDAHATAIDRLLADAEAMGPVMFPVEHDDITFVRLRLTAMEHLVRLRRMMEPLRDQLLDGFLTPLTDAQRRRVSAWRNLILFEPALSPGGMVDGPISFVFVEAALAEVPMDRSAREAAESVVAVGADLRRSLLVARATHGGGAEAAWHRRALRELEAGAPWPEAYAAANLDADGTLIPVRRDLERTREAILDVLASLGRAGLPDAVMLEGRARILARASANLGSPASIVTGAARLLRRTDLPPETRDALLRHAAAALDAMTTYARERPLRIGSPPDPDPEAAQRAYTAELQAVHEVAAPLVPLIREAGGSFIDLPSSAGFHRIRTNAEGEYAATPRLRPAEAVRRVAEALASDLEWSPDDVVTHAAAVAQGAAVRTRGPLRPGVAARRATELLQAVADVEAAIEAEARDWPDSDRRRVEGAAPRERWSFIPLTAIVLGEATAAERTPAMLDRLLAFERQQLEDIAAPLSVEDLDIEDRASVNAYMTAFAEVSHRRDARVTEMLDAVTQEVPRLRDAVAAELDAQRIPWLLQRHQEVEALMATIEADMRVNPARRIALRAAGVAVRDIARRADQWVEDGASSGNATPLWGQGTLHQDYRIADRRWRRHALPARIVEHRRAMLGEG